MRIPITATGYMKISAECCTPQKYIRMSNFLAFMPALEGTKVPVDMEPVQHKIMHFVLFLS